MNRFTIRTLMGLVIVMAVGLAALRNGNGLWAGCFILMTLGVLLTSVLRAVYKTGPSRAGWLGFSLFTFAYLVLAFGAPDRLTANLPTSRLLGYVHAQVMPQPSAGMMMMGGMSMMYGMGGDGAAMSGANTMPASPPTPPNLWRSHLPGAANYEALTTIGHCLFSYVAGLIGAVIAPRIEERRQVVVA